ncbi:hypothetical protein O5274_26785, partial [Escherichia coli]|nr:hypothetical protein [Escherichia coli]
MNKTNIVPDTRPQFCSLLLRIVLLFISIVDNSPLCHFFNRFSSDIHHGRLLTMFGMVLAIGLLVDDAIVVV